jgi:hypothetical protein
MLATIRGWRFRASLIGAAFELSRGCDLDDQKLIKLGLF